MLHLQSIIIQTYQCCNCLLFNLSFQYETCWRLQYYSLVQNTWYSSQGESIMLNNVRYLWCGQIFRGYYHQICGCYHQYLWCYHQSCFNLSLKSYYKYIYSKKKTSCRIFLTVCKIPSWWFFRSTFVSIGVPTKVSTQMNQTQTGMYSLTFACIFCVYKIRAKGWKWA